MRFECKVRVVNRNPGGKSCSSYVKSTIALGKETYTDNEYFLLHFSNIVRGSLKGSRYTKYRLKQNPTKVFTKCINEGKITISFEDPMHDLFIQGEALQLSRFVELLNLCLAGEVGVLPSTITVEAKERYNKHLNEEKQGKEENKKGKAKKSMPEKKDPICSKQEINSNAEANEDENTEEEKSVLEKNDTICSKHEIISAIEDEKLCNKHVNEENHGIPEDVKVGEQTFLAGEKVICSNTKEITSTDEAQDVWDMNVNVNEKNRGLTKDKNMEEEKSVNTLNTNYRKKRKRIRYRRLELWFSDSLRLTT